MPSGPTNLPVAGVDPEDNSNIIKILSWNVAGWLRCLSSYVDVPFIHQSYDIIIIQETWFANVLVLDGYSSYKLDAVPGKGPGRLKGGLGILISNSLKVDCQLKPPLMRLAMALLLEWEKGSLIIINVYLPPETKKSEIEANWLALDKYMTDLSLEHPEAQILMAGDLNARRGPDDCFLEANFKIILEDPDQDLASLPFERASKDRNANYSGSCLARFSRKRALHILNGSFYGDHPGENTFMVGSRTMS